MFFMLSLIVLIHVNPFLTLNATIETQVEFDVFLFLKYWTCHAFYIVNFSPYPLCFRWLRRVTP